MILQDYDKEELLDTFIKQERETMGKTTRQFANKKKKKKSNKNQSSKKAKVSKEGYLGSSPLGLFIYGPPGVGKTSFVARFPKPFFVFDQQETGIEDLLEFGQVPKPTGMEEVDTWSGLMDITDRIASGATGAKTAIFDSVTGFEKLCFHHHCHENFDDDWSKKGFFNFWQGPAGASKTDWPEWIDKLQEIRQAGINVIMIGHSKLGPYNNPWGADYDRFTPDIDKRIWASTHRWAQAILFYCYHVDIDITGPRGKVQEDTAKRFIFTDWTPQGDAKNRFGLESIIDAGDDSEEAYANWKAAFKKARKKGRKKKA